MASKTFWELTLSREEGNEPTLMPEEIVVKGNRIKSIAGSGLTRKIGLQMPADGLHVDDVTIVRTLQDYFDDPPMQVTALRAV